MVLEIVSGLTTKSLAAVGLPTVIVQLVAPKVLTFIQRYPRGVKLLTYLIAFLSVCGTFTFGIRPLLENFIWDRLPRVQLQSNDLLYKYLRRHIDAKTYPVTPHILKASADGANAANSCDADDEEDEDGACNVVGKVSCGQESDITYRNSSSRVFFHEGTLFAMETPWDAGNSHESARHPQELAIRAFAFSHEPLKSLLEDAWSLYRHKAMETTTAIYQVDRFNDSWTLTKHKAIRKMSTVDIDTAQKKKLIEDVLKYVSPDTKAWYRKRGIPCRRGYLFHGPPGTGKSSLAAAIAGHFQASLYTLSLTKSGISDSSLLDLLNQLPAGGVLLIEDIDSAGIHRESYGQGYRSRSNVTLSGLLNALDGASAPEGHILIMSTNTPEALDPALRRAGRVDCEVEFKYANKTSAMKIFLRMMGEDGNDDAEYITDLQEKASEFMAGIPEGTLSPAEIQGYLLDHRSDVQGAITNAGEWAKEVLDKRVKAQEAAEKAQQARKERAEQRDKDIEARERKEELAERALERREAAAAAFEEMERKTKEMTLKAEKLRAEAEIAKYEARNGALAGEQPALISPADTDEEDP